jgi:hypothetical protein
MPLRLEIGHSGGCRLALVTHHLSLTTAIMTPERWQQIDRLLELALEQEPGEWRDFLAKTCGGDEELCQEVEALLNAHEQAGSFIEAPVSEPTASVAPAVHTQLVAGQQVGNSPFFLLGSGGV